MPSRATSAEIGRVANTARSPSLIAIARRNCCSAIGPSTRPSTAGTSGSEPNRIAEAERTDRVQQAHVEHRAVQAVGAERCEHEHAGIQQRSRQQHHARPDARERQVQHEQHRVADEQTRDQRPHELGLRREQQRPRLQAVLLKRREQDRSRGRGRHAERQQRHEHARGRRVVRGLGPGDAFDRAVAEFLGVARSGASRRDTTGTSGSPSRPSAARRAGSRSPCRGATPSTSGATPRDSCRAKRVQLQRLRAAASPCRHAWCSVSPTANRPITRITTSMPSRSCGMPNEKRAAPVS